MHIDDLLKDYKPFFQDPDSYIGKKVVLKRSSKDGKIRHYSGILTAFHKSPRRKVELIVDTYFVDNFKIRKRTASSKREEFSLDKFVTLYVHTFNNFQNSSPEKEALRKKRLAYAKARSMIAVAKSQEEVYFDMLKLSKTSTKEDFLRVRKAIFIKWHPDRAALSDLPKEEFLHKSKQYTDALSTVQKYFI